MTLNHPHRDLIALGIRQPWVELILRGIKTIEVRSQETNVRGTIYLYASKKVSDIPATQSAVKKYQLELDALPRGVLVGTVEIVDSRPCKAREAKAACLPKIALKSRIGWTLANPQRLLEPLNVRFLPYGIWFYPFKRRNADC